MDIYVLNKDLARIAVIDVYSSLIWAKRYYDVGDCELAVPATADNLNLLQIGYYLARPDDDMICIIKKINIKTSIENGNYLIITGKDVKCLLYQRIVWETSAFNTTTEAMIRRLAYTALGDQTHNATRALKNSNGNIIFALEPLTGLIGDSKEQVSYKNVGEKIYNVCREMQWGVKFTLGSKTDTTTTTIPCFKFSVYAGVDRTANIIFAPELYNLAETDYSVDTSQMGNVTLIGGQGEGTDRKMADVGSTQGTDRYEFFTDAKDIPYRIKFGELLEAYPMGTNRGQGEIIAVTTSAVTRYNYCVHFLRIPIYSQTQLAQLQEEYRDGSVAVGGRYFQVALGKIADLGTNSNPSDDTAVLISDSLYSLYLINRGLQKIKECGTLTTFTGSVQPYNYTYRTDYNVGDVVTVSNGYGVTAQARIVEVTEVHDSNGYQTIPKFEYQQIDPVYTPPSN